MCNSNSKSRAVPTLHSAAAAAPLTCRCARSAPATNAVQRAWPQLLLAATGDRAGASATDQAPRRRPLSAQGRPPLPAARASARCGSGRSCSEELVSDWRLSCCSGGEAAALAAAAEPGPVSSSNMCEAAGDSSRRCSCEIQHSHGFDQRSQHIYGE